MPGPPDFIYKATSIYSQLFATQTSADFQIPTFSKNLRIVMYGCGGDGAPGQAVQGGGGAGGGATVDGTFSIEGNDWGKVLHFDLANLATEKSSLNVDLSLYGSVSAVCSSGKTGTTGFGALGGNASGTEFFSCYPGDMGADGDPIGSGGAGGAGGGSGLTELSYLIPYGLFPGTGGDGGPTPISTPGLTGTPGLLVLEFF